VWDTGAETAVVRAGTTANAAAIGRIVPTWDDNAFRLAIEPAGGPEIRTTVFERESGSGTLNRGASTREALEGSYRATLRSTGGDVVGWLRVDVDPEGGTRFAGDLPSTVSPALAAAAAAAIDGEVSFIYADLDDVNPLCH